MPSTRRLQSATGSGKSAAQPERPSKWLPGIPEWETAKAHRRNLSHDTAVRECAHLTSQYRRMWTAMASVVIELDQVLEALTAKKVPFVLTGAHGISGWTGKPRATRDIDILRTSGYLLGCPKGGRRYESMGFAPTFFAPATTPGRMYEEELDNGSVGFLLVGRHRPHAWEIA